MASAGEMYIEYGKKSNLASKITGGGEKLFARENSASLGNSIEKRRSTYFINFGRLF